MLLLLLLYVLGVCIDAALQAHHVVILADLREIGSHFLTANATRTVQQDGSAVPVFALIIIFIIIIAIVIVIVIVIDIVIVIVIVIDLAVVIAAVTSTLAADADIVMDGITVDGVGVGGPVLQPQVLEQPIHPRNDLLEGLHLQHVRASEHADVGLVVVAHVDDDRGRRGCRRWDPCCRCGCGC